jgi:hypothetical protein
MPRRNASKAANAQVVTTVVFGTDVLGLTQPATIAEVAWAPNRRGSGLPTVDPQQKFDGVAPPPQQFLGQGQMAKNLGTRRPNNPTTTTFADTQSNQVAGNPIMAAFADQLARGLSS